MLTVEFTLFANIILKTHHIKLNAIYGIPYDNSLFNIRVLPPPPPELLIYVYI